MPESLDIGDFPPGHLEIPVPELLKLAQTDKTKDPAEGKAYAAAAYHLVELTDVRTEFPIAAGKAAALAAFRSAQMETPAEEVNRLFETSLGKLSRQRPIFDRERIATHLLRGRATALRRLSAGESLRAPADDWFRQAHNALGKQHKKGHRWDRYATMLDKHWAADRAIDPDGHAPEAAVIATRGIYRAIMAERETDSMQGHAKFIAKHVGGNALDLMLAATKPLEKMTLIQKFRNKLGKWILG